MEQWECLLKKLTRLYMKSNKKYNVIIDTNVIVSALLTNNTDSATYKIIVKKF